MRRRLPRSLALPAAAVMLLAAATPAAAQTIPTTPVPGPADPNQPPISVEPEGQPAAKVVGDAGTALGILRLLPEAVPTSAIVEGAEDELPRQSAAEGGFGLSSAQVNSEAFLSYEQSIAQASQFGLAVGGNVVPTPNSLVQTAPPDNAEPAANGFAAPDNPLLNVAALEGYAHARWSDKLGPCIGTIADGRTSVASVSLLDNLPTMPGTDQLTKAAAPLEAGLKSLPGPLASLGGLLSNDSKPKADGSGSLLSVPDTLSTRSFVRLVDVPGTERKAVQSTSTVQAADINILKGTGLGLTVKVTSQPKLTVTSTGDAKTSTVDYTAPVLAVQRGGETLFELDAANPTKDIPIGIPLPDLAGVPGFEELAETPVIGGLARFADYGVKQLRGEAGDFVLDVGVLRLSIAQLDEKRMDLTKPFKGHQVGASARLLDLRVLPTKALRDALPPEARENLPSSLAQVSLGEQVARAYAPAGGVDCSVPAAAPEPGKPAGGAQPGVPQQLARTNAAYDAVPLFWAGTAMLLVGVVLVAGFPGRRKPDVVTAEDTDKPSPHPRS